MPFPQVNAHKSISSFLQNIRLPASCKTPDYLLPAKRQSHRPTPGGDKAGSAATGHTDSVRLVAFVFFLRHNPYAVANGVLQELHPDTDRKASTATTDALHKSRWMTIPYTE